MPSRYATHAAPCRAQPHPCRFHFHADHGRCCALTLGANARACPRVTACGLTALTAMTAARRPLHPSHSATRHLPLRSRPQIAVFAFPTGPCASMPPASPGTKMASPSPFSNLPPWYQACRLFSKRFRAERFPSYMSQFIVSNIIYFHMFGFSVFVFVLGGLFLPFQMPI